MSQSILIAYGVDRPGVLDEVSQYLFERGGNIGDSKLLSLRGTFIMMILFVADEAAIGRIREHLPELSAKTGIGAEVREAGPEHGGGVAFTYRFTATGTDQAGVLHKLSHLLRALNVNIADVRTKVGVLQSVARPQFELELLLNVPRETPVIKLREYLGTLCTEMGINWDLVPT